MQCLCSVISGRCEGGHSLRARNHREIKALGWIGWWYLIQRWHAQLTERIQSWEEEHGSLTWEDLATTCLETSQQILGRNTGPSKRPHLRGREMENEQLDANVAMHWRTCVLSGMTKSLGILNGMPTFCKPDETVDTLAAYVSALV